MKKTALYPYEHYGNHYIDMIKEAIESNGYEIVSAMDVLKNRKLAKEIDVVTLNWFDAVPEYPLPKLLVYLLRSIIRFYRFKWRGIKVIHTFHNALAHDTKHPALSRLMMRFMCRHSDRIAVLCEYSKTVLQQYLTDKEIEEKVRLVYHPTYEGQYSSEKVKISELNNNPDTMHVLFAGYIRPYKNLEIVLKIAQDYSKRNVEFTVAGNPISADYEKTIRELSEKAGNVNLILRFIEDDEMASIYDWADIVFLPLAAKSSLNSGSAMMAITFRKTLVATQVGTLMDFPQEYLFTYQYKNEKDHYQAALEVFEKAVETWEADHSSLKEMGENVYRFANEKCSLAEVAKRYQSIYLELEDKSRKTNSNNLETGD